jgi:DNA-binding MarR family transcriptional regulator
VLFGLFMDAVIFETKGTHLTLQRVGRRLLRGFGITPARFDLLHALGQRGLKQSDLWKRLNVARSVICEMLEALLALGWVSRFRAADSRTWIVRLTSRGRAIFERAYDACVASGDAAVGTDYALAAGYVEVNAMNARHGFLGFCDDMQTVYRERPWFRGPDLYTWQAEDYYFHFVEFFGS